jgi:hypothetical protein
MKKLLTTVAVLAILIASVKAEMPLASSEIAKLPQDRVVAIRKFCERRWGDNFEMRIYCEDEQYKALQTLIERENVTGK